jgi:hypothetical protein
MALITCKDCSKKFSTDAKCCPECGAKPPNKKIGCGSVAVIVFFGLLIIGSIGGGNGKATNSQCSQDWSKCKDNSELVNNYQHMSEIDSKCETAAKKEARYGNPDFPLIAFGTFHKGTDYIETGTLILYEDDAQFQNGFGAMVHSNVECTYDLKSRNVTNIYISAK